MPTDSPIERNAADAASRAPAIPGKSASGNRLVAGMGACYALGTFTDNFYKQCAILLAASLHLTAMQSYATVLFALPFIAFSAWAGWLADRLPKRTIVMAAKFLELFAIAGGGFVLVTGAWWGILLVVFLMGLQATFFSPAINGSIPESFPTPQVPRVNSLIKLASTVAVLAGIGTAGVFLDLRPSSLPALGVETGEEYGRLMAGLFVGAFAVLGVLTAFTLRRNPSSVERGAASQPFPLAGPVDSLRHFWEARKDPQLFLVLLAEAYFYGIAAIAVISVSNLAKDLSYSDTVTSLLSAALMVGIAIGALLAGKRPAESWRWLLAPSAFGMGLFMLGAASAPLVTPGGFAGEASFLNPQLLWLFFSLLLCGVCGGVYLIPLASFIQVRPAPEAKGKVLGISNFLSFVSIAVFGVLFYGVRLLPPAWTFVVYALGTMAFAHLVAGRGIRRMAGLSVRDIALSPLSLFMRALLGLRYRVEESGLESIGAQAPGGKGTLFLPNHPALVDPLLVYSRIAALGPRPLADERQIHGIFRKVAARLLRVVSIPDIRRDGKASGEAVRQAMSKVIEALEQGDNVLLYPSGRLYRSSREELGANSAVAQIREAVPGARVVLVRTSGLWGSAFSYAGGKEPVFLRVVLRGLPALLANGLFFMPRRRVRMEFTEPADFPRNAGKQAINRYLEDFYNTVEHPALGVPRFFWQGGEPFALPEPPRTGKGNGDAPVPDEIRAQVYKILREAGGLEAAAPLEPEMQLAGDLGIDSLSLMDVATALEVISGKQITDMDSLYTVGDCLLAATGQNGAPAGDAGSEVPPAWFSMDNDPAGEAITAIPQGTANIVDAFLAQVKSGPNQPLLADRGGVRTRAQTLLGAVLLARRFAALPGTRLGIMLPAAPAAAVCWAAALLAGKEPVMVNWTVGRGNMLHCLEQAGVEHIVSAGPLLEQLARQGTTMNDTPVVWHRVDAMAAGFSLAEKLRGLLAVWRFRLGLGGIPRAATPDIAAILFTSGSEARPKAVPLTHANLMVNATDVAGVLRVKQRDRVLSMLPPFHSFGLMVGLVLPLAGGVAVACHPNPTEAAPLVFLVRDFKLTLLGATPTFLEAMLKKARGADDLASVRFAFVGAEKCPDHVYAAFAECCPQGVLCEGYGITECSPVVSVNIPGKVRAGSIGHVLPSVEFALVREGAESAEGVPGREPGLAPEPSPRPESGPGPEGASGYASVPQGETGLLLVRGPSIFSGYLGDAPDPFVRYDGKIWYRTGDLVRQEADGRLVFQGRLKRFVKIGGEMISLPQMENILQSAVTSRPDYSAEEGVCIVADARPGSEEAGQPEIVAFTTLGLTAQEVNRSLREAGLSPLHAVKRVVRVARIPLLGTGKTDYRALWEERNR